VFTAPGIPMLFQGYELLDWRPWSDVVPMDWSRAGRFAGHRRFHRDLIRARTNADGRTRGLCGSSVSLIAANPDTKVLAYHRWDQGAGADDVVVIANFSGTTFPSYRVGLPYPGTKIGLRPIHDCHRCAMLGKRFRCVKRRRDLRNNALHGLNRSVGEQADGCDTGSARAGDSARARR